MGMRLKILTQAIVKYYHLIILGSLGLTLLAVVMCRRTVITCDLLEFLPESIPQVKIMKEIADEYQTSEPIVIAIENSQKDVKLLKQCARDLVERLVYIPYRAPYGIRKKKSPSQSAYLHEENTQMINLVKRIDWNYTEPFFDEHRIMSLSKPLLSDFLDMFQSLSLCTLLTNMNRYLASDKVYPRADEPIFDWEKRIITKISQEHSLIENLFEYTVSADSMKIIDATREILLGPQYILSSDNSTLLLLVQPNICHNKLKEVQFLARTVIDTIAYIQKKYPDCSIGATSSMIINIESNNLLKKQMRYLSLISAGIILGLLILAFKNWFFPVSALGCLILSIIWTLGLLNIIYTEIHPITITFGLILLGLGIDFFIHIGAVQQHSPELVISTRIHRAFLIALPGIITGAVTTVLVFSLIAIISIPLFAQLGLAMAIGISLSLLMTCLVHPAWLTLHDTFLTKADIKTVYQKNIPSWLGLNPSLLCLKQKIKKKLIILVSRPLIAFILVLVGIALFFSAIKTVSSLSFDANYENLISPQVKALAIKRMIQKKFQLSSDMVYFKVKSEQESRNIYDTLQRLSAEKRIIGHVNAFTELYPPYKEQVSRQKAVVVFQRFIKNYPSPTPITQVQIRQIYGEIDLFYQNLKRLKHFIINKNGKDSRIITFIQTIEDRAVQSDIHNQVYSPKVMSRYQAILFKQLQQRIVRMSNPQLIMKDSFPLHIQKIYNNDKNNDLLVVVFAANDLHEKKNADAFFTALEPLSLNYSSPMVIAWIITELIHELGTKYIYVTLAVLAIILFLHLRSIPLVLLGIFSIIIGLSSLIHILVLCKISLNIHNYLGVILVLGIGIDDSIHLLHHYKYTSSYIIKTALSKVLKPISLTTLTTCIGFGAIGLLSHRGIASLGILIFCGSLSIFFSTLFFLPALLTLFPFNRKKRSLQGQ
jgi:predicted RND superfamily exporter protein